VPGTAAYAELQGEAGADRMRAEIAETIASGPDSPRAGKEAEEERKERMASVLVAMRRMNQGFTEITHENIKKILDNVRIARMIRDDTEVRTYEDELEKLLRSVSKSS
jgi:hypothetical protein